MRKFFALLLAVMFLFGSVECFAQSGDTHAQVIYTEVLTETSWTTTAIPVTKIRPDVDKIIGVEVSCLNGAAYGTAILYDSATASVAAPVEMICEYEATASVQSAGRFFPFPRYIVNGIAVVQDANTRVTIYYIRN